MINTEKTQANDNTKTVSLTDLAAGMDIDEDILLERLAEVLSRHAEEPVP